MADITQDATIQMKGSWMFLSSKHLYINGKKHFSHSFAFDSPIVCNDLPDDMYSVPTLAFFRKKARILPLQKDFLTLAYNLPGVSVVSTWLCL